MPSTTLDNRFRCPPELWKQFLDKCHSRGVDHKSVMSALITYFVLTGELPQRTGVTIYEPQPIPSFEPEPQVQFSQNNDPLQELLNDDLFS